MPFITAKGTYKDPITGQVGALLKAQPLDKVYLQPEQMVFIPKGTKLAVTFPFDDKKEKTQAVRMVDNATKYGLKKGQTFYCFTLDWLANDAEWLPIIPKKQSIFDKFATFFSKQQKYCPPMKPGDFHIVVVDDEASYNNTMECFDQKGQSLWTRPCLARGQSSDWAVHAGDTPPGIYYFGERYIADLDDAATCKPYGEYCFDLVSFQDGEDVVGRAGICAHGGGSALGYPGCNDPYQELVPTFGCLRMYNNDLKTFINEMWEKTQASGNKIWVTVYQI